MPILQLSHCPFLLPRAGPSLPLAPPASGSLYTWSVSSTRWGLPEGHRGNEVTDPEPPAGVLPPLPSTPQRLVPQPCRWGDRAAQRQSAFPKVTQPARSGLELRSVRHKASEMGVISPHLAPHPSAQTSIPAPTPGVPGVGVCRGSDSWRTTVP